RPAGPTLREEALAGPRTGRSAGPPASRRRKARKLRKAAHALSSSPLVVTSRHCLNPPGRSRPIARPGKELRVAAGRWFVAGSSLALAVAAFDVAAQNRSSFSNPAEYDNYMAALNTRDPAKRATAMEVFIAWYPGSVLQLEAHEQAMAAWQAANQ